MSIAKKALVEASFEGVWFLPSPQNPLKNQNPSWSFLERCDMLRLALEDEPHMQPCDVEGFLDPPYYTHRTLHVLGSKRPKTEFALLVGEDVLGQLHLWKQPQYLLRNRVVFVYKRGLGPTKMPNIVRDFARKVVVLEGDLLEVSSSEVRRLFDEGNAEALERHLNPKVLRYMTERKHR